ncbi:MAG: hypothetical protein RLZZ308_28 [Candidatus Parcubacteria bacterium]|jgi:hypothetical protein
MLFSYFFWHYRYGLLGLFSITGEFVRFIFNLFSINLFIRTLFLPIFSAQITLKDRVVDEDIVAVLVTKVVMRIIGALLRTLFIFLGFASIAVVLIGMLITITLWVLLPVLLVIMGYFLVRFSV